MSPEEAFSNPLLSFGYFIFYLYYAVCLMVIATKTNTPNGWLAFIPIANLWLMTQIAGVEWWYVILALIPCVGLFVGLYLYWKVCEARGKPGWLALLMLIPVVNFVIPAYVAFTD